MFFREDSPSTQLGPTSGAAPGQHSEGGCKGIVFRISSIRYFVDIGIDLFTFNFMKLCLDRPVSGYAEFVRFLFRAMATLSKQNLTNKIIIRRETTLWPIWAHVGLDDGPGIWVRLGSGPGIPGPSPK